MAVEQGLVEAIIYEGNSPEMYAHYARMRHDPIYRIQERMADLEAERLPAISPVSPMLETARQVFITKYIPLEEWQSLKGELRHLENKLNEHIDRTKKAKKGTY